MPDFTQKLTGRVRYRIQTRFFRSPLLVVQIEVKGYVFYSHMDAELQTWWKDAKTEDMLVAPPMEKFPGV